ncbi:hypothetical protein [Sphingomonas sanguinis]|uniref:hypothetical protein n=1 Tax=Sphingomonas sanguinis TaxID=33051 RepID=UPI000B02ECA4|nr:hypothetical protein [Sphingomonas sanguinis]
MPDDLPPGSIEITVTAHRIPGAIQFPNLNMYYDYWLNLSNVNKDKQWLYGPFSDFVIDDTPLNHPKRGLINGIVSMYADMHGNLKSTIDQVSDYTYVPVGLGKFITGAELKEKFNGLKAVINDLNYPAGYAGANYGDRFEINWRALEGYVVNYDQAGVNYLILHELAHNTEPGVVSRSWMINSHKDAIQAGTIPSNTPYGEGDAFLPGKKRMLTPQPNI